MHTNRSTMMVMALAVTASLVTASSALAHTGDNVGGLQSGFMHPVSGLDHVVAMLAVGLWGGILRAPAVWLLPIVFPLMMALGGAAGVAGVPLAGVEIGIALSGVILGLAVLFVLRPGLWIAAVIVGIFAIFHGHAHGTELPDAANPIAYAVGFVIATGLLHLVGIAIGHLGQSGPGRIAVRAGGGVIALAGAAFLTGIA